MLEVRGLTAGYGNATILQQIDLTVGAGTIVALIGANGAGKSTLLKTLAGLLPAKAGSISLDGVRIDTSNPASRVRRGLSLVPEGRQVFGGLSVEENLRLGAYVRRGLDERALRGLIEEACEPFPMLRSRLKDPAANLSGGQQQMLAIARGLMSRPRLLMLDEPSLGLSPTLVSDIFRLVTNLRSRAITLLLSEQNARQSLAIADYAYVLENGRIIIEGRSREILDASAIAEKYLGVGKAVGDGTSVRQHAMNERLAKVLRD
jgi:branched-chain amino acid transport system ATP-binding protein